jgi:predicted DNA-binding ribbon-helix-helix protein
MRKRSVKIAGHATSITLEQEFWTEIQNIAEQRGLSINGLITHIDETRETENLSSAIRLFVLKEIKNAP